MRDEGLIKGKYVSIGMVKKKLFEDSSIRGMACIWLTIRATYSHRTSYTKRIQLLPSYAFFGFVLFNPAVHLAISPLF